MQKSLQEILSKQTHAHTQEQRPSVTQGTHIKSADDLKHLNQNVDLMKNRVNHLRMQLQKQKDSVKKHKNLTQQVIKQKIQIHKFSSFKNAIEQNKINIDKQTNQMRVRNNSFRQNHKHQMNNILKALYLVKLDDARQMKNMSMENRRSLQKRQQNYLNRAHQIKKQITDQSQQAKKRYIEYYKNKLNSVYAQGQKNLYQAELIAQQKKKLLEKLKQEEMELLQEINKLKTKDLQAKKQYVAALSLNPKEVAHAIQQKNKQQKEYQKYSNKRSSLIRSQQDLSMVESPSESIRYKNKQFFSKDPTVSMMSSHNIKIPRPKVDQNKFQIILKELKKLEGGDRGLDKSL